MLSSGFFNAVANEDWQQLEPGRLARLRLRGVQGNLDFYVVYLATGIDGRDSQRRRRSVQTLTDDMAEPAHVLSLVGGDWNFVTTKKDRCCKQTLDWTGDKDTSETEHFCTKLLLPFQFHEMYQEQYTCETGRAFSRLDRIYSNHCVIDQLDRRYLCGALLPTGLSAHRPVSFSRVRANPADKTNHVLPTLVTKHPDWAKRVAVEVGVLEEHDGQCGNPFRRLVLCKRAIRTVTENMAREHLQLEATEVQDTLSCVLSFIRAAEEVRLGTMQKRATEYPKIAEFVPPLDPEARSATGFLGLKQHAIELAREEVTSELRSLHSDQLAPHDQQYRQRKQSILTKLKRLLPGTCEAISVVKSDELGVCKDPEDIALALQRHWGKVFARKPIDTQLLQRWLHSLPQLRQEEGRALRPDIVRSDATSATQAATGNNQNRREQSNKRPAPQGDDSGPTGEASTSFATGAHHRRRARSSGTPGRSLPRLEQDWRITRREMLSAIRSAGNTMPGPDGIPFAAWKALGNFGLSILCDVTWAMEDPQAETRLTQAYADEESTHTHDYNKSTLICLPKKVAGHDELLGDYYTPETTRPLSIVNCDNRIVANAVRIRWEPHLRHWVKSRQQGFIQGRSILTNLLELEMESMLTALEGNEGACVLLDFSAAFPSISQDFLHESLKHIGIPQHARNVLNTLYSQSYCQVSFGGKVANGFDLDAGVRQGCPLSPLLYATVAEIVLEKIATECDQTTAKAYADDTALVVRFFWRDGPKLATIFQELEQVAGLRLNMNKCIIIPLDGKEPSDFAARVAERMPEWRDMKVASTGKYLGFHIGPGKGQMSWQEPLTKYRSRCGLWGGQALGLQYNALVYNTFAVSVLSYVGQLEPPPINIDQEEEQGLRKVAKGPYLWATPADLCRLKEHFGGTRSFKSISAMAWASKVRVATYDKACSGGRLQDLCAKLRAAMSAPGELLTRARWAKWFEGAFIFNLNSAVVEFETHIVTRAALIQRHRDHCRTTCAEGGSAAYDWERYRAQFQRTVYEHVLAHRAPDPVHRIRHKLARFELQDSAKHALPVALSIKSNTPAANATRALRCLRLLGDFVAPRIVSAVFSAIWNRWTTHRRFQQRAKPSNKCLLCDNDDAQDALEHYCRCTRTKELMQRYLNLDPERFAGLHTFLLCNPSVSTVEELTTTAVLIYTIYTATNHYRHNPRDTDIPVYDALAQWAREGCKHHRHSTRVLDNRWNPWYPASPLPR